MVNKLKLDYPYSNKEVLQRIQKLDKKAVNLNKNIERLFYLLLMIIFVYFYKPLSNLHNSDNIKTKH